MSATQAERTASMSHEMPVATEQAQQGSVATTSTSDEDALSQEQQHQGSTNFVVFAPPSDSMPMATQKEHDANDFKPSVDQMQRHQARLASSAVNKRLPSDLELAQMREAKQRLAQQPHSIEIKFRLPDQVQVVKQFSSTASSRALFEFIQPLLKAEVGPISLGFMTGKGREVLKTSIHDVSLASMFGLSKRALMDVLIQRGPGEGRISGGILKSEHQQLAQPIFVQDISTMTNSDDQDATGHKKTAPEVKRKNEIPKWLRLPGKK